MVPWLAKGETTEAYGRLLKVRPDVDPLPPYRRGLCTLEAELYGASQLQILQILAKGGRKTGRVTMCLRNHALCLMGTTSPDTLQS